MNRLIHQCKRTFLRESVQRKKFQNKKACAPKKGAQAFSIRLIYANEGVVELANLFPY
jgi:hypothetical protein